MQLMKCRRVKCLECRHVVRELCVCDGLYRQSLINNTPNVQYTRRINAAQWHIPLCYVCT